MQRNNTNKRLWQFSAVLVVTIVLLVYCPQHVYGRQQLRRHLKDDNNTTVFEITDSPSSSKSPSTTLSPDVDPVPSPSPTPRPNSESSNASGGVLQISQSIIFYVIIGILVAACGMYNTCFRPRPEHSHYNHMTEEMTYRQDLIESETEINSMWQCDVCGFHNNPQKTSCLLCGSDKGYLSASKSEIELRKSGVDKMTTPRNSTKLRATTSRKLAALNPRQIGARKRNEWIRKLNDTGELVWKRQKLNRIGRIQELQAEKEEADRLSASSIRSVGYVSKIAAAAEGTEERLTFELAEGSTARIRSSDSVTNHDLHEVAKLPFRRKHAWFMQQTACREISWEYGHMLIEVDRENLLHGSCERLLWATPEQLHQSLRIKFRNEPGVDAGGLEREWFTLMAQEIFDEGTGLFLISHDNMTYTINPCSEECSEDHLMYFQAIGRFLGRALFQGHLIPAHLSLPLYKHIVGAPITFSDLQFVDMELYNSLKWMKENDHVESLCLDFSVTLPYSEGPKVVDLKPNGRDIEVTDENKHEYIELRMKWILVRSVSRQLSALIKGVYDVIPPELLCVFDYQELELLMSGVPEIDVDDWQNNSQYFGEFPSQLVQWFWEIVRSLEMEQRARLLQFVTGSARVPVQGFKALTMNDGRVCLFTLQGITFEDSMYPRAHTCFNRLDLPPYEKKEDLQTALVMVINTDVTGFTIE